MNAEDEPIAKDEFVLRLIWRDFFIDGVPPKISERAFRPRPDETNGISVFRESCLSDPSEVLNVIAETKREKYGIVRLPVSELLAMGLSVESSKIESLSGHAVVPELNIVALHIDAKQSQKLQNALAEIAKNNVIRKPTS